jgi:hypothetical protein
MKEIYRSPDLVRVELFGSILRSEGIETFVYNSVTQQSLAAGLITAFFPLPLFYPRLCVLNDDDYSEAMKVLEGRQADQSEAALDWKCSRCGETVPASFEVCWSCGVQRD